LSKRMTQQVRHEILNVPVSLGTISQLERATTAV
jgi:hypothetical protein